LRAFHVLVQAPHVSMTAAKHDGMFLRGG